MIGIRLICSSRNSSKVINMIASEITENVSKNYDLWKSVVLSLILALVGQLPKSARGITLNLDGETIQIVVFFEGQPSE